MISMKKDTLYQILLLQMQVIENSKQEMYYIRKHGYVEEAKRFNIKARELDKKLDAFENDLRIRYASLELNSKNLDELQYLSNMLLLFKDFDETFLFSVQDKINELLPLKETALKEWDFKKAGELSEEIFQLERDQDKQLHLLHEQQMEEKEEFDEGLGQRPLRFGISLDETEEGEVMINKLLAGSSAFKSGMLNAGDKIIAVQEPGRPPVNVSSFMLLQVDSVLNEISGDQLMLTVKKPDGTTSIEMVEVIKTDSLPLEKSSDDFKFSAAVAWFGLKLRDSKLIENKSSNDIKSLAQKGISNDKDGYKAEFIRLAKIG